MLSIHPCALPDGALLASYRAAGAYTDCYAVDIPGPVTHARYVTAFYTTAVFKLERFILKWALSLPSTDAQAGQLAAGTIDHFAAWRVEKRGTDQVLMCDFRGRTRSWLMVAPVGTSDGTRTRLYFGSAVVPEQRSGTDPPRLGLTYRALLGFHKLYSTILLRAAKSRLEAEGL